MTSVNLMIYYFFAGIVFLLLIIRGSTWRHLSSVPFQSYHLMSRVLIYALCPPLSFLIFPDSPGLCFKAHTVGVIVVSKPLKLILHIGDCNLIGEGDGCQRRWLRVSRAWVGGWFWRCGGGGQLWCKWLSRRVKTFYKQTCELWQDLRPVLKKKKKSINRCNMYTIKMKNITKCCF